MAIILYFSQIYVPCYYGNKAATASDDLVFSLYSCSWFDMPVEARKMIIIMMQNSQSTMYFGIAQFFRLSMEQFGNVSLTYLQGRALQQLMTLFVFFLLQILNTIYSIYTLIRELQ